MDGGALSALSTVDRVDQATGAIVPMTSLQAWAVDAQECAVVAAQLARTPFVPASLRDRDPEITTANITAVLLTGQEMGLQPMAALRSIDIINGTPGLRAITLRGLVQAHGHQIWVEEQTDTRAIVSGVRRGESKVQTSVWTHDRARALKLLNKPNWVAQRSTMLVARATGECARWVAADVLLGLPYIAEELEDGEEQPAITTPPAATRTRTAQRRSRTAKDYVEASPHGRVNGVPTDTVELPEEPEFTDDSAQTTDVMSDLSTPDDETPDQDGSDSDSNGQPPPVTEAQMKALQAAFREIEIEREQRLRIVRVIVHREIGSARDLTADEAHQVLDVLSLAQQQGDPREWLYDVAAPEPDEPALDDLAAPESTDKGE